LNTHNIAYVVNGCLVWQCCVPDDAGANERLRGGCYGRAMTSSMGTALALAVAACVISAALACSNTPSGPTSVSTQYPATDPPFVYVPPEPDASDADLDAPSKAPVEADVMGDARSDAAPDSSAPDAAADGGPTDADACAPGGGCTAACVAGRHNVTVMVDGCLVTECCVLDDADGD
jgi:hypothetical protein